MAVPSLGTHSGSLLVGLVSKSEVCLQYPWWIFRPGWYPGVGTDCPNCSEGMSVRYFQTRM